MVSDEQDRKNAAYQLNKSLWADLAEHVVRISRDVFQRDKPESVELVEEYLERIKRAIEWSK